MVAFCTQTIFFVSFRLHVFHLYFPSRTHGKIIFNATISNCHAKKNCKSVNVDTKNELETKCTRQMRIYMFINKVDVY